MFSICVKVITFFSVKHFNNVNTLYNIQQSLKDPLGHLQIAVVVNSETKEYRTFNNNFTQFDEYILNFVSSRINYFI